MEKILLTAYILILLAGFLGELFLDSLNLKQRKKELPASIRSVYPSEKYQTQQHYESANDKLSALSGFVSLIITLMMLIYNGFAWMDASLRQLTEHTIWLPFFFFAIISIATNLINLPFSYYRTFTIEQKFGFNTTTRSTFVWDKIKTFILGGILGGLVFIVLLYFYFLTKEYFWILAWVFVAGFSLFMTMFYSRLIVPLFNKQTPLGEGELRDAIQTFAIQNDFKLEDIYLIDGSKRSTKANAYFTGFGKRKRIVLYDTLINELTIDQIVAVLAHEIGHYKLKHTPKQLILSNIQLGLMLFILSLFLKIDVFSLALGVDQASLHIALVAFGILYSPISSFLGLGINLWSRKHEYEADLYATKTGYGMHLIEALKLLSVNNLSNINPHPWYVFFHYSHPTLAQRITHIEANQFK